MDGQLIHPAVILGFFLDSEFWNLDTRCVRFHLIHSSLRSGSSGRLGMQLTHPALICRIVF